MTKHKSVKNNGTTTTIKRGNGQNKGDKIKEMTT